MKKPTRVTVAVAGALALGAILSGTAFADDEDSYPDCEPVHEEHSYWLPMYNGNRSDDRAYGSDDYRPQCTGFHGKDKSNSGYNGTDESRYDDSDYLLGLG